jgi:hypothetical protein
MGLARNPAKKGQISYRRCGRFRGMDRPRQDRDGHEFTPAILIDFAGIAE